LRFSLDEHLSTEIAEIGRALGLDVVSSHELGRDGLPDEEQLRLAALDGRCLVTKNRRHFTRLTLQFFEQGRPHAGVLVLPASWRTDDFGRIARALASYAEMRGEGPTDYLLDFLR
jgi:hypothetical protein